MYRTARIVLRSLGVGLVAALFCVWIGLGVSGYASRGVSGAQPCGPAAAPAPAASGALVSDSGDACSVAAVNPYVLPASLGMFVVASGLAYERGRRRERRRHSRSRR